MTTTISRLYDNYADAQRAVRDLEAAGVPHSDISIVANNSEGWYSNDKKVDRDRDGVDDRAEGAGTGAGVGAGLGGAAGLLAGLGLLAILVWVLSLRQDGSRLRQWALRLVQRLEASSARLRRQEYRTKTLRFTLKAFVGAEHLSRQRSPMPTVLGSMQR